MRAHTVFAVVVLSWTALACGPATVTELEGDEAGECDDAVDNDQDGATNCADSGCEDSGPCVEVDPNDVDDYGDGVTENEGDDEDPAVFPQAGDVYADGVDSDCDGLDCEATMDGAVYFALCSPGLWADAAAVCSAGGHDFGSVQSDAENALLEDLLRSSPMYQSWPTAGGGVIWLNYTNASGAWTWGDGYAGGWTNWAPGMPDQTSACAYLDIDGSGGGWPLGSWDDTTCATGETRALLCTDR